MCGVVLRLQRIAPPFCTSVIIEKSTVVGILTSTIRNKASTTILSTHVLNFRSILADKTQVPKLAREHFIGLLFQSKGEWFMVYEHCERPASVEYRKYYIAR